MQNLTYLKFLSKMGKNSIILLSIFFVSILAQAKINVVTTLPDIAAVTREVGGDEVRVEAIVKGTQDPHAIEAKPSYMVKLNHADLLIAAGLSLEKAWLDPLIQGARNPKLNSGSPGHLELGDKLDPIEVPTDKVSRAQGDVHPEGNPHFYLDPIRIGKSALIIADRLSELDPSHGNDFKTRAQKFEEHMKAKTQEWQKRLDKAGIKKIVTHHKTLNYFFDRFGIRLVGELEPKPGIPPTAPHIMELISTIRQQGVKLVLVENYFDHHVGDRISDEVKGTKIVSCPVAVGGESGLDTNEKLFERIVSIIEGAAK